MNCRQLCADMTDKKNIQSLKKFLSQGRDETLAFAATLGESLEGGELIFLNGELGSGKTVFAKGIAKGLGVVDSVTSPTFTLMNIYEGKSLTLCHFDLYRLGSVDELFELGMDEYIHKDNVVIVEWGKAFLSELDYPHIFIEIDVLDAEKRNIRIMSPL